jgi:hypothetical protein
MVPPTTLTTRLRFALSDNVTPTGRDCCFAKMRSPPWSARGLLLVVLCISDGGALKTLGFGRLQ